MLYQKHSNVKVLYLQLSELRVNYKATIIHSTEHYHSNVNQYISCLTDERDLLVPVCLVIKEHISRGEFLHGAVRSYQHMHVERILNSLLE